MVPKLVGLDLPALVPGPITGVRKQQCDPQDCATSGVRERIFPFTPTCAGLRK